MKNLRRLTLAFVIIGGFIGLFAKLEKGFIQHDNYVIAFSKLPKKIGPFVNQGRSKGDGSLQLRSGRCAETISMTAYSVKEPLPEEFTKLLYPATKWRTLYVYRGQAHDAFARIPAYFRFITSQSIAALSLSTRNLSDEFFFCFHIPVECTVDLRSAIAASNVVLASAVPSAYKPLNSYFNW